MSLVTLMWLSSLPAYVDGFISTCWDQSESPMLFILNSALWVTILNPYFHFLLNIKATHWSRWRLWIKIDCWSTHEIMIKIDKNVAKMHALHHNSVVYVRMYFYLASHNCCFCVTPRRYLVQVAWFCYNFRVNQLEVRHKKRFTTAVYGMYVVRKV